MFSLILFLCIILIISISIMYELTFTLAYNSCNKILASLSFLIGLTIFATGIITANNMALNLESTKEINIKSHIRREEMEKYDYYIEVTNDIECWLDSNDFDLSQFENREEAAEFLRDELWADDTITGNGLNGYATEEECEEFLCHNWDLAIEGFDTFGVSIPDLRAQYKKKNLARYIDCFVRLYVLDAAIEGALITWEGYGFRYKGKNNES